jgi:hypothetical protein
LFDSDGQTMQGQLGMEISDFMLIKDVDPYRRFNPDPIDGSPYHLSDSFVQGSVFTHKMEYPGVWLRYNIFKDYIEYKDKEKIFALDPRVDIKEVVTARQTYKVQPFDENGKIKLGYFIALDTGEVTLLVRKKMRFEPKELPQALEDRPKNAAFVALPDLFYIRVHHAVAKPIFSIKKVANLFPDHQKSISSFIQRKKLKLKEEHIRELWTYYRKLKEN